MKSTKHPLLYLLIFVSIIVYTVICYHSVEEIHYLKSFFPVRFTVEEAFYATAIELIKVFIIGTPFLLVIGLCLALLRNAQKSKPPDE